MHDKAPAEPGLRSASADLILFITEDPIIQIAAVCRFVISVSHLIASFFAIQISIWSRA